MPRFPALQPSSLAAIPDQPGWPAEIYGVLKAAQVQQVSYVPDAGHRSLIELAHADPAIETTVLTTEEEASRLPPAPGWGSAGGAPDAVERRRQLHQHAP